MALALLKLVYLRQSRWSHLVLSLLAGFSVALLHANYLKPKPIPLALHNTTHNIEGRVVGLPKLIRAADYSKLQFRFRPLVNKNNPKIDGLILVNYYGESLGIKSGDIWQLKLKLRRANSYFSPASFDYETWAYEQGIVATAYLKPSKFNRLMKAAHDFSSIDKLRERISELLKTQFTKQENYALIAALVVGDKRHLSKKQWNILRATGTAHLVAISGLHISLLAGFAYYLVFHLWSFSARLSSKIAAPKIACVFALLAAAGYAALAGFALPTQRALLMVACYLLFELRAKPLPAVKRLQFAMVVILIFDPFALLSVSFYLSFVAVCSLLLITNTSRMQSKYFRYFSWQFYLVLFITPLSLYFFKSASFVAPLANLVAIPIVSLILVPISLIASLLMIFESLISSFLFSLLNPIINILDSFLSYLKNYNPSGSYLVINHFSLVFLVMSGFALLIYAPLFRIKLLACFFLAPMFFGYGHALKPGQVLVTLFDVGQGLAVLIQTQHRSLLYDTGTMFRSGFNTGTSVIVPYFNYYHIRYLDMIMISHLDKDHVGGLKGIIDSGLLSYGILVSSELIPRYTNSSISCRRGQVWFWDRVKFELLHPKFHQLEKNRNNRSCVLKISAGKYSILITGDIHSSVEQRLVYTYKKTNKLKTTLLVAPHHGSLSSSSWNFLRQTQAEIVLISAGFANRFGFPRAKVLARYSALGIQVFDTIKHGTLKFLIDAKVGLSHESSWRINNYHYWQRHPEYSSKQAND